MAKNKNKPAAANPAPAVNADRFAAIREQYPTAEEFRKSIEGENENTLRASAQEFEINLKGRDAKPDIIDTIVEAVYPPESSESGAGGEPTPAHDPATDEAAKEAADKTDDKEAVKVNADNKQAMDSTTESAEGIPGAAPGDVIGTTSPANPNERWTESNEEKKKHLSAAALDRKARGEPDPEEETE